MKLPKLVLAHGIYSFSGTPAQDSALDFWRHKPTTDPSRNGISIGNAHSLLIGRSPEVVIVALLHIGMDYMYGDLNDVMWNNPGEMANNGLDNGRNVYIDDVHGWIVWAITKMRG